MTAFFTALGRGIFVGRFPQFGYGDQVIYVVGYLRQVELRRDPPMNWPGDRGYLPRREPMDCTIEMQDVQVALTWADAERMVHDDPMLTGKTEVMLPSTLKALPPGKTP